MAIYIQIMSKSSLFFRSVGRGPPCSLPSLWWKGPPGRAPWLQHVTCGQQQWAALPSAAMENPNFAASAMERSILTCLQNYPKTPWQLTLMLCTTPVTNQAGWHGAASQEFGQESAINPRPVIKECGGVWSTLLHCAYPHRTRTSS